MRDGLFRIGDWLRRRAENVASFLITAVFVIFVLQIVFRYVLNLPVGWTQEVSTLAWVWLVLWGSAFIVTERDEIRFDILYSAVPERWRRVFTVVTSLVMVVVFAGSLPAVIDYVTFMRVEHTSYIHMRLDYVFSIYVIFALAAIVRYLWLGYSALKGNAPETMDPTLSGDE